MRRISMDTKQYCSISIVVNVYDEIYLIPNECFPTPSTLSFIL